MKIALFGRYIQFDFVGIADDSKRNACYTTRNTYLLRKILSANDFIQFTQFINDFVYTS